MLGSCAHRLPPFYVLPLTTYCVPTYALEKCALVIFFLRDTKVDVRALCCNASAWCALDETLPKQVWLVHLFNRGAFFFPCGREGSEPHRTAAKFNHYCLKECAVCGGKAYLINFKECESALCHLLRECLLMHLGKVSASLEEVICRSRRIPTAAGNQRERFVGKRDAKNMRRALKYFSNFLVVVKVETK